MAMLSVPVWNIGNASQEAVGGLRYVARQPILDLRGRVHGFELLFRSSPEEAFRGDGDHATRTMLDNTVMFGLEKLTGDLPAFVNCTRESLMEGLVEVLPPSGSVLEVLESVEPSEDLIAACKALKKKGFRIALDDFSWQSGIEPLVELSDYIKVDFLAMDAQERRQLLYRIQGSSAKRIAEKIETQEDYQRARDEGFNFFQGYYFCRPILLKQHKVPSNCALHMEILKQLQSEPLDIRALTDMIKLDPSLTLRLLRLANSPICSVRQRVKSIRTALVVMGDEMLRRVLTLAIASEWNAGRAPAVLQMVFLRARFCELAAKLCALDPTEQYLLGMLSLLPAMLRLSMEELVPSLPLRIEIRQALLGESNTERSLLNWIEFHERADWEACDTVGKVNGFTSEAAICCYNQSVVWAEEALHFVS